MKKAIGALSIFLSVMLISYSIFGWVWAATYTFNTPTKIYEGVDDEGIPYGNLGMEIYSGTPMVYFADTDADDGRTGIFYAEYVGSGGDCDDLYGGSDAWACALVSSVSRPPAADMTITSDGKVRAVFADNGSATGDLFYSSCDSDCGTPANWTNTKIVEIGSHADIELVSDVPRILYRDGSDNLEIARFVGGASGSGCVSSDWDCTTIDADGTGGYPDMHIDGSGNEIVIYNDSVGTSTNYAEYVSTGGTGCSAGITDWTCAKIDDTNYYYNGAITYEGGKTAVTYNVGSSKLWYSECSGTCTTGANWSTPEDIMVSDYSDMIPSIDIDSSTGNSFVSMGSGDAGPNGGLIIGERVGGNSGTGCDYSDNWNCFNFGSLDNNSVTESSVYVNSPPVVATMGGGGVFYSESSEDPAIPEFGTKLAAVLVGASAFGLFGLIVMFRGRQTKGKKRKK